MAEDEFRVEVELGDTEHHLSLGERLRSLDLDDEARKRLGPQVVVTRDRPHLFLYTASREAAAEAERVVRELVAKDSIPAELRVRRWHQDAAEWRDADEPARERGGEGDAGETRDDESAEIPHPLFVWSENYKPEFLRDLGL